MHDAANCGRGYMIVHPRWGLPLQSSPAPALIAAEGANSRTLDAD
ncbi:hypothetical protein CLV65_0542 [Pseudoscardovia suis]|uniref:Uncharacterized protein n=1 Tax=Pseudoscardovia suis TaxID=987063 RepID=A0A261ES91_9BIFI|nr:hypothetical protein PSSU_1529 [Pseudoscardovia suis]PJJ69824.1 hypothetical protein CLV65_0542 [Pseudoscardovia suis]